MFIPSEQWLKHSFFLLFTYIWNLIEELYNYKELYFNPSLESGRYMILLSFQQPLSPPAFEVSPIQIWIWEQARLFYNFIMVGEGEGDMMKEENEKVLF